MKRNIPEHKYLTSLPPWRRNIYRVGRFQRRGSPDEYGMIDGMPRIQLQPSLPTLVDRSALASMDSVLG